MKSLRSALLSLLMVGCLTVVGCGGGGGDGDNNTSSDRQKKIRVAFVTNGIASFWDVAAKGAQDAAEEFGVEVEIIMPPEGAADQKRLVEDLLTKGIDGVAISPIDPDNQGDLLAKIAEKTNLITHDSDAPESERLCYIGMDNYAAGRMCGELVREACPDGANIMVYVGRLEQLNAKLRREGTIDGALNRAKGSDEAGDEKYKFIDTRTDQFDRGRAKELVQDSIAKYSELDCMVGLFAYNPPIMLDVVKEASLLDKVRLVGFDEADETLQGIVDGEIYGTVVQNPYKYGYESVRVLAGLAKKDKSVLPEGGFLDIPARKITKDNVEEFWAELKKLTGETEDDDSTDSDAEAKQEDDGE